MNVEMQLWQQPTETVRVGRLVQSPDIGTATTSIDPARVFISSAAGDGSISATIEVAALRLLTAVRAEFPTLPTPTVALGEDDLLGITWNNKALHLNVEIFSEHLEYFSEDLGTGILWSEEHPVTDTLPSVGLRAKLARLTL